MAGGKSLEARSWGESGSIERSGYETPEGVKFQTGEGAAVKYPSAPRKSVAPQSGSSNRRKTVSAPRGDASRESGPDAVEDGGGDLSKDGDVGGVESTEVGGVKSTEVGGPESTDVGGAESTDVGGAESTKVGGVERTEMRRDGNQIESAAGDKVVRKLTYSSAQKGPGGGVVRKEVVARRRLSKSKRACLVMPVAKVLAGLKKGRYASRVRVDAAVYLAATLEYLVAEVLELAGNCSKYMKRKRVTPQHIQMTFLHDSELGELTKGVIVPEGGVKLNILKELLPPRHQMKTNDDAEDSEENDRAPSTDVSSH